MFDPNCGSREVLDLIADKLSALILYALRGRTLRHAELQLLTEVCRWAENYLADIQAARAVSAPGLHTHAR